jgi:hypothetical protein
VTQGRDRTGHVRSGSLKKNGSDFEIHNAPERGRAASIGASSILPP